MAKFTAARRRATVDARTARLNSGYLRIYSGTQPTDADTALAGNTLLAELVFNATAFGAASGAGATATANAITSDTDANATGTPTFARLFESDGTTVVCDATVGTSGTEIILSGLTGGQIILHGTVSVSSMTLAEAA